MRRLFLLILVFVLVFATVIPCFADTATPVILPQGDSTSRVGNVYVNHLNGLKVFYWSNAYPVYIQFYRVDDVIRYVVFSEDSSAVLFSSWTDQGVNARYDLSNYYNGYYYDSRNQNANYAPDQPFFPLLDMPSGSTVFDVIDYIDNSVFSTTFSLSSIVGASLDWLTTFASFVASSPLLLLFVLFSFVGIAIGLLFRFRRL